jgi:hypothetical protein
MLCIVNIKDQKVWLIPSEDLADITFISLKHRYNKYLLSGTTLPSSNNDNINIFRKKAFELASLE